MGRIVYMAVSDMHCGAVQSLATPTAGDVAVPSPVAAAFGRAVRGVLARQSGRPVVVLLGDALDMAFSDRGAAAQGYVGWLRGLIGDAPALFADRMVVVPGNHDHALWLAARGVAEAVDGAAVRATGATMGGLDCALITGLNRRAGLDAVARLHYPNFALHDAGRCVAFHHGHFVEPAYRVMSLLRDVITGEARALSAADLAEENARWIEFGWAAFGQGDALSRQVAGLFSTSASAGGAHQLRQRMAQVMGRTLAPMLPMGGHGVMKMPLQKAVLAALNTVFGAMADAERAEITQTLSQSSLNGLRAYLEGPLAGQLRAELGQMPRDLTFVFGHTHKPFVDAVVPENGPVIHVCNTGGWALDSPRLNGRVGVSLVLVDVGLHVVAVRAFATPVNGLRAGVEVRLASKACPEGAAFLAQIKRYIAADAGVWDQLAEVAAKDYEARQDAMLAEMALSDHATHRHASPRHAPHRHAAGVT